MMTLKLSGDICVLTPPDSCDWLESKCLLLATILRNSRSHSPGHPGSLAEFRAHIRCLSVRRTLEGTCPFLILPTTSQCLRVKSIPVFHHFVPGNFFPELSQFCWACARCLFHFCSHYQKPVLGRDCEACVQTGKLFEQGS